jgi:hypothetical protein
MVVKQHSVMCGFRPSAVLGRAHPEGSLFFATFFKFHRNAVKTHPSFLEQFRLVFSSLYSFKKKRHVCLEAGTAGVHLSESERTESVCLGARRGPEKLLPLSLGERERKKTRPEILLVDRMSVVSACPNPPDPFLGKEGKSDGTSYQERRKRVQLAIDGLAS